MIAIFTHHHHPRSRRTCLALGGALLLGMIGGATPQARAAPAAKGPLKVGYFMDVFVQESPAGESRTQFESWVRSLVNYAVEGNTEAILYDSYNDFIAKLTESHGQLWDVCPMYAYDFVRLRQRCNLEAILVPEWDAGPQAEYTLYVGQNSRVNKVEDLQHKRVLFEIGGRGELPYIWFDNQMRKVLPGAPKDSANLRSVPTALRAALPVFFGEDGIEGCVLTQGGFKEIVSSNPQIGKFLRPVVTAPKLLTHVIACRRDLPADQREKVIKASLELMEKTTATRSSCLHFEVFKPEYLENLEHQWLEYQTNKLNEANDPHKNNAPDGPPETLLEARAAAARSTSRDGNSASSGGSFTNPFRNPGGKERPSTTR